MDLTLKGKNWVGNIYQKFEAMCQDVDDFVSQDTVKYVENQVQTVGGSVKKFYSDVVQDLLHASLMDPTNCEAQAVPQKQNDAIGTYIRSMVGIEEKPVYADIEQSSAKQDPVDPLENCHVSSFSGHSPVEQFTSPPTAHSIKEAESNFSSEQRDDALMCENLEMDVQENLRIEEQCPCEELTSPEVESSEALLFRESIDKNHEKGILAKVSSATLVHNTEPTSSQKERTIYNNFPNEVECVFNVSRILQSSMEFSIVSCENKVAEGTLNSSSSSLLTDSYNLSEFSHANFYENAEKICCSSTAASGCGCDLLDAVSSSGSSPTVVHDNNVSGMGLTFSSSVLSLESNDVDNSRTDEAVSVARSSGDPDEQCCGCTQSEAFMSSFEIEAADDSSIDIADSSMETIDLSEKAKLDESCVFVDGQLLYPASFRARKFRSYKKIIQDAFASKKRLTKEYEQLAIWYGDIDIESSQHSEQNLLALIPTMSLESKKSVPQDICDTEWELL